MAILKRISVILFLPLILTGCFSDFDPKLDSKPVLCMNSLLVPGEQTAVSLTRTWRWDEGAESDLDLTVKDAEVNLYVNGEFKESLILTQIKNEASYYPHEESIEYKYVGSYKPSSGDLIKLEAESSEYGKAWAEVRVPEPVEIDKVEYSVRNFQDYSEEDVTRISMSMDCQIWFQDPAEKINYYQFKSGLHHSYYSNHESQDGGRVEVRCFIDYDHEPLFTEHLTVLEHMGAETYGYTFFSDRQISGKSYPINIVIDDISYFYKNPLCDADIPDPELNFTLQSISESYYNHILSVWVANDGIVGALGSVGLGDAVFASSNVSTKAGVVAAYSLSSITLNLREIIDKIRLY